MRRKPMMLDAELVDKMKEIASRHGMTLASYMRSLITNLIEAENRGVFAPLAIRKALLLSKLRNAGLILVPPSIINDCEYDEKALRDEGKRIGILLKSLGVGLEEALDLLVEDIRTAIREKEKIIIVASSKSDKVVKELVRGIAEAYKAPIREEGEVTIIELTRPL